MILPVVVMIVAIYAVVGFVIGLSRVSQGVMGTAGPVATLIANVLLWPLFLGEVRSQPPRFPPFLESPYTVRRRVTEAPVIMNPRERFEQVIAKGVRDAESVRASLDVAESVASHFGPLIEQYLQNYRSPAVPPQLLSFYADLSARMLRYGLFTHFICFGSDNRARFRQIDPQRLYERWEEMAVRALSAFDAYSRDIQGFPDAVFRELYGLEAEATVRESGGFVEKGRIESAVRDRFATGVVFGMAVDMAAASS